jgi:hypothetical protein
VRQRLGEKVNVFSTDCRLRSDEFERRELVDEKARTSFIGTIAALTVAHVMVE